jgi:hypothetical protein
MFNDVLSDVRSVDVRFARGWGRKSGRDLIENDTHIWLRRSIGHIDQ